EACPVLIEPSAAVAGIVTGLVTAAVQVAVICVVGEAERWTEGSLAVQLELTRAPVESQRFEALKAWLLPGTAAAWSAVAVDGVTLMPKARQVETPLPPQPAVPRRITPRDPTANSLNASMVAPRFFLMGLGVLTLRTYSLQETCRF